MKKILALVAVMILALAPAAMASDSKPIKIGVTTIVTHPALEADQKGFAQALADAGLTVEFDLQNAQGEMSNAMAIAKKFQADQVTLVHAIATPTAQAAVKEMKDIPIVYSSVTDPVSAGLVSTMDAAGGNVTGVSDALQVERILKTYTEMMPGAKTWGTIYNAGEANSVVNNNMAKAAAEKLGLKWVEATVANSSEILTAAQSLVGRVDAIFITTDNTVVSGIAALSKVAKDKKIPFFACDVDSVPGGAAVALGFDYFQVGYSAGKKAAQILKGEKAGAIPSGYAEKLSLVISVPNAEAQGLKLDAKWLTEADKVVK